MVRNAFAALIVALLITEGASGQDWARKMFDKTEHDFGTVARGAKAECHFKITNPYKETIHISGVRSSCGCTSPKIVNPTLKTHETGEIVGVFNTRTFTGQRGATLTVSIDQPYPAEIQVQVKGHIRQDVVFYPGVVQLGTVNQGKATEKKVTVNYAGRSDWEVVDVLSTNPYFEVELDKTMSSGGRTSYDLLVRLKEDTPVGYLSDQLVVVTNDQKSQQIPLAVEGRVVAEVTVTPESLYLGDVAVGQKVTKRLVVRGRSPFKIVDVECEDKCFKFDVSDEAKTLHLVSVTFVPKKKGQIQQQIRIRTDQGDGVADTSLVAYATVNESAQVKSPGPAEKLSSAGK